jgi:hypothetical protein
MKFDVKTKIISKEFVPNTIIPRSGQIKKLDAIENEDSLRLSSSRCRNVNIPKNICLTSDDFIAIGLYLAEGTTYCNPNNKTKHCGEIGFVISHPQCILLVCKLLNKFNISTKKLKWLVGLNINYKNKISNEDLFNYWIKKIKLDKNNSRPKSIYYSGKIGGKITTNTGKRGCLHIYYASTIFRNYFLNFINKALNDCIKNRSKEKLALILKGFFAGDGCVNYSRKFNRKQVEFSANDLELSDKLRKSLKILGLTSIRETWPEFTKNHTKSLRIYNEHDFRILAHFDILELINYKRKTFTKIMNSL